MDARLFDKIVEAVDSEMHDAADDVVLEWVETHKSKIDLAAEAAEIRKTNWYTVEYSPEGGTPESDISEDYPQECQDQDLVCEWIAANAIHHFICGDYIDDSDYEGMVK